MIYRVEEGKTYTGAIGYQTSSLAYTFSHWTGTSMFRLRDYGASLKYKPIGPTILVEWTE